MMNQSNNFGWAKTSFALVMVILVGFMPQSKAEEDLDAALILETEILHSEGKLMEALIAKIQALSFLNTAITQTQKNRNLTRQTKAHLLLESATGRFVYEVYQADETASLKIVDDGKWLWRIDYRLEQVVKEKAMVHQDLAQMPILIFTPRGQASLRRDFFIMLAPQQNPSDPPTYIMIPRDKSIGFEEIKIGFNQQGLRMIRLRATDGQTITLHLQTEQGKAPRDKDFRAKYPRHFALIDEGA